MRGSKSKRDLFGALRLGDFPLGFHAARSRRRRAADRRESLPRSSGSGSPACGSSLVIFARSQRAAHHGLDAFGREIGGVGRARALAHQHADSRAARAGLLQVFHLAHADAGGEFFAFGDGALGVGRAELSSGLLTASAAICSRSFNAARSCGRSAHGHPVDLHGGDADAHRDALPFLAADADAFVELADRGPPC